MKQFLKMTLAAIVGCLVTGMVMMLVFFGFLGAIASIGNSQPVMPVSAVLRIDMSTFQLGEQTKDVDILSAVSGNQTQVTGILDAIRAIEAAAADPAVKYIYMKPDMAYGGMAEMEELRQALLNFRLSGKAVISYIENPTNAGYYLASASDKIFMTPHQGGMNMLTGISSQMVFLKDILAKLGVNVQLIRHGKYKSAGEMFVRNEASPENLAQNEELIASIWDSWSSSIADSRNISVEMNWSPRCIASFSVRFKARIKSRLTCTSPDVPVTFGRRSTAAWASSRTRLALPPERSIKLEALPS